MIAIITGDIINSRKGEADIWLNSLKETLNQYGSEPKEWEIFRGDSFQLSVSPEKSLLACFHIKAVIKQQKSLDVRLAIGLGEEKYSAEKITEANGSAYINSGECFDSLKKETLAIKSPDKNFDRTLNLMLNLSLLTADNWSSTVSEVIKTAIENPEKNQKGLAEILNKSQSGVSEAFKRGGFEEIMNMNDYYTQNIVML